MRTIPPLTAALVGFLNTAMVPPFSTEVPANRPAELGIIRATGGGVRNLGQADPAFSVELWAASSARAETLAREAWSILDSAEALSPAVWVARSALTLPVDYPDILSRTPRWVFVYTATILLTEG